MLQYSETFSDLMPVEDYWPAFAGMTGVFV